jgi:hypothetical protein
MKSLKAKQFKENPQYWVEPDGRVWSEKSQKFLKPTKNGANGKYRKYTFRVNGKVINKSVHRLVMEYFGPEKPDENSQVNHIDGNGCNNDLKNLEWVSPVQNTAHAIKTGLRKSKKLTIEQVKEIKRKFEQEPNYWGKIADMAREYKIGYRMLFHIKNNESWGHIKV